jgi:hypothetical protein
MLMIFFEQMLIYGCVEELIKTGKRSARFNMKLDLLFTDDDANSD